MEYKINLDTDEPLTQIAAEEMRRAIQSYADDLLATMRHFAQIEQSEIITKRMMLQAREYQFSSSRARELAEKIGKASNTLDKLQGEHLVSSRELAALRQQIEIAKEKADQAVALAELNEKQAAAVNTAIDNTLDKRLTRGEKSSRKREWGLGTIGALIVGLIVGVLSILIVHFTLGF